MNFSAAESVANGTCTAANTTATNGIEVITATSATTGKPNCVENLGAGFGAASLIYAPSNLPVVEMKLKPATLTDAGSFVIAGMSDGAAAVNATTAGIRPAHGIYFDNCSTDNGDAAVPTGCSTTQWYGWVSNGAANTNATSVSCPAASITAGYAILRIEVRASNDVHFFVDTNTANGLSEVECGSGITGSANIPSANMGPWLQATNVTNGVSTSQLDVDYYRSYQDDNVVATTTPATSALDTTTAATGSSDTASTGGTIDVSGTGTADDPSSTTPPDSSLTGTADDPSSTTPAAGLIGVTNPDGSFTPAIDTPVTSLSSVTSGNANTLADGSLNSDGSNLDNLTFTNANTSATSTTVNGLSITPTGTDNTNASANILNAINLPDVTPVANNTFNGLNFGSGYNNYLNAANWSVTSAGDETLAGSITLTGTTSSINLNSASPTLATSSANSTVSMFVGNATTINIGDSASTTAIGGTLITGGNITDSGGTLTFGGTPTIAAATPASAVNLFGNTTGDITIGGLTGTTTIQQNLTVGGSTDTAYVFTIGQPGSTVGNHIVVNGAAIVCSTSGGAGTAAPGTGIGSDCSTVTVRHGSNDAHGSFDITTGGSTTVGGDIMVVNFKTPYATPPLCVISRTGNLVPGAEYYISATSNDSFTVTEAGSPLTPNSPGAGFSYICEQ
jgi:hypothetical protein